MTFFLFCVWVSLLILLYHLLTLQYLNPYKLTMVFGKKGSGKTTLLAKLAIKYLRQGIPVYSTEDIPGTYKLDPALIGTVAFPEGAVVLVDEVGMIWDNRNFKSFSAAVRDWFKLQRHYKLHVYLFSQTFDVDKKIRDLVDDMYLVERKFRVFSYAKRIICKPQLIEADADHPSQIVENLVFDSLFWCWCGSRRFTFIPKYAKFFDSFSVPALTDYAFEQIPTNAAFDRAVRCVKRLPPIRIKMPGIFRRRRK